MSYNFNGIKQSDIELLCLNRFNDSRSFYEQNKEQLKQGITMPMRKLVLDLSYLMSDIDDKIVTDPVKCVARIYRDTRGRRSKIKYRENIWLFLRRSKYEYPAAPMFYFELHPDYFDYGLGFFPFRAAQIDVFHKFIIDNEKRWLKLVKECEKVGFTFNTYQEYKKVRYPNASAKLQKYLQAKSINFSFSSNDMSYLENSNISTDLNNKFSAIRKMYDFMIEAYQIMIDNDLINF